LEVWARAGLFDLQPVIFGFAAQAHFDDHEWPIASHPASEFHADEGGD
jgi:hypothetical protein